MSDDINIVANKRKSSIKENIKIENDRGKEKERVESNKEEKERSVNELRKKMQEDAKLKILKCDDVYLERFLAAVDYNVEEAFTRIQQFYEVLEENPKWFSKESPNDKQWMIERDVRVLLKERDKEGRPIYIIKLAPMDPSTMDFVKDVVPVDDFFVEGMFIENMGLENGLCVIIDIANFPYKMTKWATPHNVRTGVKRMYSMPIKDYRYHVVNSSMWINIIIRLIWPFLPQKVKEQVKFHFNDFEALHQHIDKDVLPEEYGGSRKMNPAELHLVTLNNSSEIANNFRLTREVYLEQLDLVKNMRDISIDED